MYLHEYREDSSLFTEMTEMNVNESISMGILVVNDGLACQNKVAQVLQRCNYEVLHTGTVYDALHAIWENKDRFDLVITNAQKLESEGVAIIQNIKERLKLNVLLIRSDERVEPKGELLSFSAYFVNGLTVNGFNSLLENEKRAKEEKMGAAAANQQENVQAASDSNAAAVETNKGSSSIKDAACLNQKWKAMELYRERSEDSNDDHCKGKKLRVTWTNEMHQKFLNAIERLGYDKAVPKKIVEVMGVPGLSRENVASHLQKYRCSMRRTQETIFGSLSCRNTRTELKGLGFLTSPSTSKDLVFGSRLERKFCTRIGGSHLSDVGNMMQCRANKHSSSTDNSSHSDTSKFVGYRFVGNQIDYGPINKINTDAVFSTTGRSEDQPMSYVQHHQISDQNAFGTAGCIQSFLLGSSASRIHGTETSQEPDLLSSYASRIESLLDGPPTQQPHQISAQQSGCSDSLLDQLQSWDSSANAALFHDPSTTSSLVLPPHQDFPLPPLEAPGNGFSGQNPAGFFDDILQQQCSPPPPPLTEMFQNLDEIFDQGGNDDHLINGIGNAHDRFDIQEFDDTFFGQDD